MVLSHILRHKLRVPTCDEQLAKKFQKKIGTPSAVKSQDYAEPKVGHTLLSLQKTLLFSAPVAK